MGRKIMIVEDDRDIRRNVSRLLSSEGYAVEVAGDGQEALTLLQSTSEMPCVIILDLMMPIMDGFQFREQQAKLPSISQIPVIIMTADGHIDEKKIRTGANLALKKPTDIDTILNAVHQFCPA